MRVVAVAILVSPVNGFSFYVPRDRTETTSG